MPVHVLCWWFSTCGFLARCYRVPLGCQTTHSVTTLEETSLVAQGYVLLLAIGVFFVWTVYAAVLSKFMPDVGHPYLDWVKRDTYYCFLVPLTIPVTFVAIYFNWLGLKLFRHN